MNKNKSLFSVKEIAVIAMMTAILHILKVALAPIPNVEVVTLLVMLFSLAMGWKALIAIFAFVLLQCTIYGFGLWTVMYFYIWPVLTMVTLLFRKCKESWIFAVISALYGFLFGALCAIPYLFIGGLGMAFTWWVSGIPFDLIHGVSNFVIAFLLFKPLRIVLRKILRENEMRGFL